MYLISPALVCVFSLTQYTASSSFTDRKHLLLHQPISLISTRYDIYIYTWLSKTCLLGGTTKSLEIPCYYAKVSRLFWEYCTEAHYINDRWWVRLCARRKLWLHPEYTIYLQQVVVNTSCDLMAHLSSWIDVELGHLCHWFEFDNTTTWHFDHTVYTHGLLQLHWIELLAKRLSMRPYKSQPASS